MRTVTADIPGDFLDAFLYRGHLYALTVDNRLRVIRWRDVLRRVFPSPDDDVDPVAQLVFMKNSTARGGVLATWSAYESVRHAIAEQFDRMAEVEPIVLGPGDYFDVDLGKHSHHSIDMYYSHVWLSGEDGLSYLQAGPGFRRKDGHSRIYTAFEGRVFSMRPCYGMIWVASAGEMVALPISSIDSGRVRVMLGEATRLNTRLAPSVSTHWRDIVLTGDQSEVWAWEYTESRFDDYALAERRKTIADFDTGETVSNPLGTYRKIDLAMARTGRLFCDRERAVTVSNNEVAPAEWAYDLSFDRRVMRDHVASIANVERVLVSTFGWVVEAAGGVSLVTRDGVQRLHQGEVVQIRTFPNAYWFENIVLMVLDGGIRLTSVLDYDFLRDPREHARGIGRKSQYLISPTRPTVGRGDFGF